MRPPVFACGLATGTSPLVLTFVCSRQTGVTVVRLEVHHSKTFGLGGQAALGQASRLGKLAGNVHPSTDIDCYRCCAAVVEN